MNVEIGGYVSLDFVKELADSVARCRDMHLPMTVPAFTSSSPCRQYRRRGSLRSCSANSPGTTGQGAKDLAPGRMQSEPGGAKDLAPGRQSGPAKDSAPGRNK
jgi:hypothetical protein